jgi:hypothetical protein
MFHIYCMRQWCGLFGEAFEETIYDNQTPAPVRMDVLSCDAKIDKHRGGSEAFDVKVFEGKERARAVADGSASEPAGGRGVQAHWGDGTDAVCVAQSSADWRTRCARRWQQCERLGPEDKFAMMVETLGMGGGTDCVLPSQGSVRRADPAVEKCLHAGDLGRCG